MNKMKIAALSLLLMAAGILPQARIPGPGGSGAAAVTISLIQHANKTGCSGTTCVITASSTTAGNLLVVAAGKDVGSATVTGITGDTFTQTTSCNTTRLALSADVCWYRLAATGGATSFTVTWSNATGGSFAVLLEYHKSSGVWVLDTSNTRISMGETNPAGATLTLSGANDAIVQALEYTSAISAISAPYTAPADFPGSNGVAGAINTASGTAPTWTSSGSGEGPLVGIAFK